MNIKLPAWEIWVAFSHTYSKGEANHMYACPLNCSVVRSYPFPGSSLRHSKINAELFLIFPEILHDQIFLSTFCLDGERNWLNFIQLFHF